MTTNSYTLEQFRRELLMVLVLYECDLEDSSTWQSLIAQESASVLIYDNGRKRQTIASGERIRYIHDPDNPGVSKAYNVGAQHAVKLGMKWMLLLDQDTRFPENAIEVYWQSVTTQPKQRLFVPMLHYNNKVVSPFKHVLITGRPDPKMGTGSYSLRTHFAMNSGMLISLEHFQSVNGYDESFPLDFSDFAFLHRMMQKTETLNVVNFRVEHHPSFAVSQRFEDRIFRFEVYCKAALHMKKYTHSGRRNLLILLMRSLKLMIRFRSHQFLQIAFHQWASV